MLMTKELPIPALAREPFAGIPVLTDDGLFAACGVRVAFTGRAGGSSEAPYDQLNLGNHVGDDLTVIAANRNRVLGALGASGLPCIVPKQVHETRVVTVKSAEGAEFAQVEAEAGADAVLVAVPGVAAQLSFADCLSLIIVSPTGRFAVVHAGWRGALAGIAGISARALSAADQAASAQGDCAAYNAYIGPYIHEECFVTGADVVDSFVAAYGEGALAASGRVSLSQVVGIDLQRAGMTGQRVADCGICTVCHSDEYFSYRAADGRCGRHGAIAFKER